MARKSFSSTTSVNNRDEIFIFTGLKLSLSSCLGAEDRFLSCNRTQSRAVTGLLTGHNTLRRHLHLMGLSDSLSCRRCGAEDETSAHILCECEALASHRRVYLGSFFLEPDKGNVYTHTNIDEHQFQITFENNDIRNTH